MEEHQDPRATADYGENYINGPVWRRLTVLTRAGAAAVSHSYPRALRHDDGTAPAFLGFYPVKILYRRP
ncbi:hypothetical protein EVAR_65276_1 [Eumeta japonica]|uniref:Uncharacterized protein n=1 Tax=Eumeta variegata TaxID=151549 RepID=A0A4C1ZD47_EUMVA|nr:hypothetical protein EVAR_65276_1 [Eumeta japonica]